MKENPLEDGLLRKYLLGELSEEEADEIERRLLIDDELFVLAEAVEADLLAAGARGELAPAERERVLKRLASSPQGRERLALARVLNATADKELREAATNVVRFPRRKPAARWAALAASLLAVTALSWLVVRDPGVHEEAPILTSEAPAPANPVQPKAPEKQPIAPRARTEPAPDRIVREREEERPGTETIKPLGRAVLQLALAVQRGEGEVEKLSLAPDVGLVELQLDVAGFEDLESFDVAVRNQEQHTVWQESSLKPQQLDWGAALVLEVPAGKLAAGGRYEVQVQGTATGGETEELSPLEFEVVTTGQP